MKVNFTEMTAQAIPATPPPGQFVENIIDNKRVRRDPL